MSVTAVPILPIKKGSLTKFWVGAALVLDEFALWLHLDDVYWSEEGKKSIDAVMNFSLRHIILGTAEGQISPAAANRMTARLVHDAGIEPLLKSWVVIDNHDIPRIATLLNYLLCTGYMVLMSTEAMFLVRPESGAAAIPLAAPASSIASLASCARRAHSACRLLGSGL